MKIKIILLALPLSLFLAGCGGGGSTSANTFTDWNSISKPSQVNLEGLSTDVSYSAGAQVTSINNKGTDLTATANITYRANNTISKVQVTTQNGTVTFDEDGTDTIGDVGPVLYGYNQTGSDFFLAADPLDIGWNYQTFGMWETGRGTGSGTAGAISVGAATTGSSIPTSGTATYTGYYSGALVDTEGYDFLSTGDVSVGADFGNRSLSFSASGGKTVSPVSSTPTWTTTDKLDMSGILFYNAGTNSFTGAVAIPGDEATGTATGKFYGPNAEELGGVFRITGEGISMHAGAFGAAR